MTLRPVLHDFRRSLSVGEAGERWFRAWACDAFPGLRVDRAAPQRDQAGIDFEVARGSTWQLKWERRARETGNVFVETVASIEREAPGWGVDCAAEWLFVACPGLGVIFQLRPPQIAAVVDEWRKLYGERDVRNAGWTTRGVAVPIAAFGQAADRTYWSNQLRESDLADLFGSWPAPD